MPCRVGITTDPEERKSYWQGRHPNMYGWVIVARYPTKTQAQARETSEARARGCQSSPGGGGPERGNWCVYYFQY